VKRYIQHIQSQPPHYRRQHAAKIATAVTAVIFVGWLATLGVRVGTGTMANTGGVSQETQFANAISGVGTQTTNNTLEVSTTTTYTGI